MKIFLIRHGETTANVDKTVYQTVPDHAISLTDEGCKQAQRAGSFLRKYIFEHADTASKIHDGGFFAPKIRLWTSPYARTRQTSEHILANVNLPSSILVHDSREHINLCEQQFGLFDGIPDEQLKDMYPREYAHYEKTLQQKGKFWARMPLGESRFDLAVRVHQSFGTFQRDAERHGITTIIVVCHGATLRAFVMQWLHLTPEWFNDEPNPPNCAIRLLDGKEDKGYIYRG